MRRGEIRGRRLPAFNRVEEISDVRLKLVAHLIVAFVFDALGAIGDRARFGLRLCEAGYLRLRRQRLVRRNSKPRRLMLSVPLVPWDLESAYRQTE